MPSDTSAIVVGDMPSALSVSELRQLLKACGLTPSTEDTHHVGIKECSYFIFRETGKKKFMISGDAETVEIMLQETAVVSMALTSKQLPPRIYVALTSKQLPHRFEVYDSTDKLVKEFEFSLR